MTFPPPGRSNISAKVVVCKPFPLHPLTSLVFNPKVGIIALIKEDFPTPECPLIRVVLFCKTDCASASPSFFQHLLILSYIQFLHTSVSSFRITVFLFRDKDLFIEQYNCGNMIGSKQQENDQ